MVLLMSGLDRNFYATCIAIIIGIVLVILILTWIVKKDVNLRKFLRLAGQYIRYTLIVKNWQYSTQMALSLTADGFIECANNTFKRKFGYKDEEIDRERMSIILSPGDLFRFEEFKNSYSDKDQDMLLRVTCTRKDESKFQAEISVKRLTDDLDQTKVSFAVSIHDITHRILNEEAHRVTTSYLQASCRRSVKALELLGGGAWEWDMETDIVDCDLGMRKLFGLRKDEKVTSKDLMGLVLKEDQEKINEQMERSMELAEPYDVEYRIGLRNGIINNVRCLADPLLSENKKVLKYHGAVQLLQQSNVGN